MKKIRILLAIILTVSLVSCASISKEEAPDFFGIYVYDEKYIDDFTIQSYSSESGVKIDNNKDTTVRFINASASLSHESSYKHPPRTRFHIKVWNGSTKPIDTNYFGDKYTLVTKSGSEYVLDKPYITRYFDSDAINPGVVGSASVFLNQYHLKQESVKHIVLRLGSGHKKVIILKPVPKQVYQ